jgi:phenylacetate-CoA ligase
MYSTLYKYARLALPSGRALRRNLNELLRTQWLSKEEVQTLQWSKIKRLLEHAYSNVPFYRQRFDDIGLHPNDIKSLADFRQIPLLSRAEVKENLESFVAVNFPRDRLGKDATGGSTGEPLNFYYHPDWRYWNWATAFRVQNWYRIQPGCRQAWIAGRDFVAPAKLSQKIRVWFRRQKWLNSFDMSEDKLHAFAETLVRFKPEFIIGYNSSLWLFAQYLEQQGITEIYPKAVQGGAEKLYDFQREVIERVFNCPLIDYYASREIGVMAAQCPEGSIHVSAEICYLEVVDDNGQPAMPGEIGEVVVTDLVNWAMPFIRYKNGDMASLEDHPCRCGRGLPVLRELAGRTSDFFTTPEGKIISGLYFVHRLRGWPGVKKYQVHQSAEENIEILFEAGNDLDQEWLENRRQEFQANLGSSVKLSFKKVDQIPPTRAGKHVFTTSKVPLRRFGEEKIG